MCECVLAAGWRRSPLCLSLPLGSMPPKPAGIETGQGRGGDGLWVMERARKRRRERSRHGHGTPHNAAKAAPQVPLSTSIHPSLLWVRHLRFVLASRPLLSSICWMAGRQPPAAPLHTHSLSHYTHRSQCALTGPRKCLKAEYFRG